MRKKGRKKQSTVTFLLQTIDKMSQITPFIPTRIWASVVTVLIELLVPLNKPG